jgi:hypothetical protein
VRRLTDDQLWDMTELQVVRAIRAGDAHTDDLHRWRELDDVDDVDDLFSPKDRPWQEPVEDDILDDDFGPREQRLGPQGKLAVAWTLQLLVLGLLGYALSSR